MARLGRPAWLLVDLLDRRAALVGLAVLCVVMSDCADSGPRAASVSRPALVPTATVGHFAHFPLPPGVPAPNRLTAGPDGALWFTAFDTAPGGRALFAPTIHDALVRLTTAGSFTAFPLPYAGGWPGGITAGPDGNVWFTEFVGDAVGRITPQGAITEFLVPPRPTRNSLGDLPPSQPFAIAAGPEGTLWFPDLGGNRLWRLTPAGGVLTAFPIPPHPENPISSFPEGIALGPDGNLWFTEATGMRIGRLTPTGHITEFKLPGVNHVPLDIIAGADGALWFLEPNQSVLGRITTDGRITEVPLPHDTCYMPGIEGESSGGACQVQYFAIAPDGAVWFSEPWRRALGSMDEHGHLDEFILPALSAGVYGPAALAVGPDGGLWFPYSDGICRFSL